MKKYLLLLNMTVVICSHSIGQHNTYFVGHSGFGFSQYNLVGAMLQDLAIDGGINSYDYGDQIIGGSCLSIQWENHNQSATGDSWIDIPAGNSSGSYDILVTTELIPITEALDSNLAPWTGCNLTPYKALDNFHDLAKTANPNTIIYMMEFHNEADFTQGTPTNVFNNWSALNASTRPLWEHVADSVSQINNGAQICIIPVAAASEALADSIMNGKFPGITNFIDMFEPTDGTSWKVHFTDITYYLSACVHYATIFQQSPVGLTNELAGRTVSAGTAPTPAQALVMQQIAWEIVMNDSYNCFTTTGLKKNIDEAKAIIYPNPSQGTFNISLNDGKEMIEYFLYNSQGQVLQSNRVAPTNLLSLDLNNYPNGIYFVNLTVGEISFKERLIKY